MEYKELKNLSTVIDILIKNYIVFIKEEVSSDYITVSMEFYTIDIIVTGYKNDDKVTIKTIGEYYNEFTYNVNFDEDTKKITENINDFIDRVCMIDVHRYTLYDSIEDLEYICK